MTEKNTCIDCGREILDLTKRRCKECIKESKRKHLSNIEISAKYNFSRDKIKNLINSVLRRIDHEMNNLNKLKEKFIINRSNLSLLNRNIGELILLKEQLINILRETSGKEGNDNPNFDINKFLFN